MEIVNFFFGDLLHFVGLCLFADLVFWNVRRLINKD